MSAIPFFLDCLKCTSRCPKSTLPFFTAEEQQFLSASRIWKAEIRIIPIAAQKDLDGAEPNNHPRNNATTSAIARGLCEYQRAQIPNVRKTSASARRSQPHGRLE